MDQDAHSPAEPPQTQHTHEPTETREAETASDNPPLQPLIDVANHHNRNNESFSRSRSSTGAWLDTSNIANVPEEDDSWFAHATQEHQPNDDTAAKETRPIEEHRATDLFQSNEVDLPSEETQPIEDQDRDANQANVMNQPREETRPTEEEHLISHHSDPVEDFNAAFEENTEPNAFEANLADNDRKEAIDELEQWADRNNNPKHAPHGKEDQPIDGELPSFSDQIHEATVGSTDVEQEQPTESQLTEPLLDSVEADPIPAPAEDADFGEALKEVAQDLNETPAVEKSADALFGDSQEVDDDWLKASEQPTEPDLDDSWAKAMGDSDVPQGEGSWEATFGDGFDDEGFLDDDGFLEEEAPAPDPATAHQQTPKTNAYTPPSTSYAPSASQPPSSIVSQAPFSSPFAPAAPSVQPAAPQQVKPGFNFYEDLPVAPSSRAKRAKQQVVQPPGAAPSPIINGPPQPPMQPMPPQQPSAPLPPSQAAYPQLQPPQKLDLFPPQPTLSPDAPTYTQKAAPPPSQMPQTSRYSPAPTSSAQTASRYANAPPPSGVQTSTRYSPALTQPQPPPRSSSASYFSAQPLQTESVTRQPPAQLPTSSLQPPPPPQRSVSARYSPAPTQPAILNNSAGPSPPPTYSPGDTPHVPPPAGPPPSLASHRFAPRTSSPLAQPESRPQLDRSSTVPISPVRAVSESRLSQPMAAPQAPPRAQPPKFEPPRRPRTQSPERQATKAYAPATQADRRISLQDTPASASAPALGISTTAAPSAKPQIPFQTHGPSESDNLDFMQPSDPCDLNDPLQRWKGAPKLHWSSGSAMVKHFPRRDLRFGGGRSAPACKTTAGDLKIDKIKDQMPVDEALFSFPGPLKSKNKKKDVLTWMTNRIDILQREGSGMDPRVNERLLLWKTLRIFVEHDGALSGNPSVDSAVKQVLTPPIGEAVSGSHSRSASLATVTGKPDANNPFVVDEVRRSLVSGEREKAVWHAVDNRLWGHAMLIASTTEGTLWKQVAQEFIRSEVRSSSADRKSLAALYSIMAQNWDESVDELVPASARAGFQMMSSTADSSAANANAIEGLNKWQETLSLVVGNRSPQDEYGLVALGKLLRDYGRVEAAHICFLFAPSLIRLGGLDDSEAHVTLVGADVSKDGSHDTDAILLTELYEFGLSLRPSASSYYLPHLQAYKLYHGIMLADAGYRTEASSYCDAISTALKSTTRPSPYYHPALITRLDDLNQRLSQAPKDGSSWISKPTVGKMSGSMWAKFNSFVSGDDDAASNGSGQHSETEASPFAKLPGGTPTISRNASHADLSSFTPMNGGPIPPIGNSRYAPSYGVPNDAAKPSGASAYQPSTYSPSVPSSAPREIVKPSQPVMSPPSRSESFGMAAGPGYSPYQSVNHLGISDTASQASSSFDPPILQHPGLEQPFGSPSTTFSDRGASSHGLPHEDMPSIEEEATQPQENGYSQVNGFEATGGYAPPTGDSGYVPYEPEADSPVDTKPKKRFGDDDDDDDIVAKAAALKGGQAPTQRAPSEAVRKAAEEDAKRDQLAKEQKKGWFGGWFGGKKDPNAPTVYKAKLGEENSFYYDTKLNRWINKKAPQDAQTPVSSTPPPPKARPVAPTSAPGSAAGIGPPSRTATPQSDASGPVGEGVPPPAMSVGPPSNPPSRPATSMSNDSSIDDLLGPGARRGGTAKRAKKRQVVDVMAK